LKLIRVTNAFPINALVEWHDWFVGKGRDVYYVKASYDNGWWMFKSIDQKHDVDEKNMCVPNCREKSLYAPRCNVYDIPGLVEDVPEEYLFVGVRNLFEDTLTLVKYDG
jgi:hypothetical protein